VSLKSAESRPIAGVRGEDLGRVAQRVPDSYRQEPTARVSYSPDDEHQDIVE